MRKSVSLLVLNLLLGSVACEVSTGDDEADDDAKGRGRVGGDAGERGTPVAPGNGGGNRDAGTAVADTGTTTDTPAGNDAGNDAGTTPQSDAATAPSGDTAQTPEQCKPALPTASVACSGPDVFEPNDEKASAIQVSTGTGCALVPGKLSSGDDYDWYLFTSPRADPVLIELAYETTPTGGAELGFQLFESTSTGTLRSQTGREDLKWTLQDTYVVKKNLGYQVMIRDDGTLQGCQGYNLRIDPQFCTDAFEDNDSRNAPAAGITAGTMISATAFSQDEDWYDLSALQATGASCAVSTDIAPTSTQELTFQTYGAGTTGVFESVSVDGIAKSAKFTVKAGGGVSLLMVRADVAQCANYTVLCTPL